MKHLLLNLMRLKSITMSFVLVEKTFVNYAMHLITMAAIAQPSLTVSVVFGSDIYNYDLK